MTRPRTKTFIFDTTSEFLVHWAGWLAAALDGVVDARIEIELVGPGGGNPAFRVEIPVSAESAWTAVRDQLLSELVGWSDENGDVWDDHL